MLSRNATQLATDFSIGRSIIGRGFFDLFYQWSRVGCGASRRSATRPLHTKPLRRPANHALGQTFTSSLTNGFNTTHHGTRPQSTSTKEPPLSTSLRTLMRTLPHSVVVLTTSTSKQTTKPQYRGMTLSSFTTLTLTPSPIITFNIRQPSQTLSAISESKHFLIHVLEGSEQGAGVADIFTRGNGRGVFEGLDIEEVEEGGVVMPMLRSNGIMKVLKCEVLDEEESSGLIRVGDHVLVLARVHEILGKDEKTEKPKEIHGLCYADGRYRGIGDVVEIGVVKGNQ